MINYLSLNIKSLYIGFVGNKAVEDGLFLSKHLVKDLDSFTKESLVQYFIESFKSEIFYNFQHTSSLDMNEVYSYATQLFDSPKEMLKISNNLAKHLYDKTNHPNVKSGEFYVVYFEDIKLDEKVMDAIGIFKSESKDTFLKVYSRENDYFIEGHTGINVKKLDKGCLIFNTSKKDGYKVCIVDNLNKSFEAEYWKTDFLNLKEAQDTYHFTKNLLSVTKNFITSQLPEQYEIDKPAQINLLNKSVNYFNENEIFDIKNFEKEVFEDPGMIKAFRRYGSEFISKNEIDIADTFEISDQAVKKQARIFKSVIKLDKNFHIYVHGPNDLIQQGVEKDGRKYYKIYFSEEK